MMNKWRLITNISFADYKGVRIWCHALLIDKEGCDGIFDTKIRQIRALTYGGLPVCTFWIKPDCEVRVHDEKGTMVLMSQDGNDYNLGGMVVKATGREGDLLEIGLGIDDFRGRIVIEDIEQERCPFGDEIDNRILPHAGGQAYPRVEWTTIPVGIKAKV